MMCYGFLFSVLHEMDHRKRSLAPEPSWPPGGSPAKHSGPQKTDSSPGVDRYTSQPIKQGLITDSP